MRTIRLALIMCLLAGALAVVSGCGSSDDKKPGTGAASAQADETAARAAAAAYIKALVDKDGAAACANMTEGLKTELLDAIKNSGAEGAALVKGKTCAALYDAVLGAESEAAGTLNTFKVTSIKVAGTHADYKWTFDGNKTSQRYPGAVDKVGGRWLVSCCVGDGADK